jgi:hypothetical protein
MMQSLPARFEDTHVSREKSVRAVVEWSLVSLVMALVSYFFVVGSYLQAKELWYSADTLFGSIFTLLAILFAATSFATLLLSLIRLKCITFEDSASTLQYALGGSKNLSKKATFLFVWIVLDRGNDGVAVRLCRAYRSDMTFFSMAETLEAFESVHAKLIRRK